MGQCLRSKKMRLDECLEKLPTMDIWPHGHMNIPEDCDCFWCTLRNKGYELINLAMAEKNEKINKLEKEIKRLKNLLTDWIYWWESHQKKYM